MLIRELLSEAMVTFTPQDLAKATAESKYGVIYLTMTGNGEIHIGALQQASNPRNLPDDPVHDDVSWRRKVEMTVQPSKKELDFRMGSVGESLKPKVQQALRALRDAGIIDNTWTIKTTRQASGYVQGTFTNFPNPVDERGLDALADKAIRLTAVTKDIVLYHGTSLRDWEQIQRVGLHPLGFGTNNQHGSESRGKHEGNTKVLYLAGTQDKALDYAKLRLADQNRKRSGNEHIKDYDNEAVVLAVHVPDPGKLVADDDVVNRMARDISRKLWKAKPPEEKQAIMAQVGQQRGFEVKDTTVGEMLWRETDAGFAEIFRLIPPAIFKTWKSSLFRENQVGYKGFIPPKFIKRVM